jgi:transcriptional regulator with XRE-family HTH domain
MKADHKKYFEIIGNNIKRLRIEKGLSQQKLANNCDKVDRSKISDIENAKEDFMLSTLLEICLALEIDLIEITVDVEKKNQ